MRCQVTALCIWLFDCNFRHPCWSRASQGPVQCCVMRLSDETLGCAALLARCFCLGATEVCSSPLQRTLSNTPMPSAGMAAAFQAC